MLAPLLLAAASLLSDEAATFGNAAPLFLARWANEAHALHDPDGAAFVARRIAQNLREKREAGFPVDEATAERTVLGYELFKFRAYVSSGVFPKRYFGYVDFAWDTAARERELRETVRGAVERINALQAAAGARVRITDAEVTVTFLAEGGAILLREKQAELDRIHPVLGVGLDDIATGFRAKAEYPGALDLSLGTHLADVVAWTDAGPRLTRLITFREAIAATAIMWTWEKELADRKLRENKLDLLQLPVDRQFIVGSLVYNSGRTFTPERVRQIHDFATGGYLSVVSQSNQKTRWPLPVGSPAIARAALLRDDAYPEQPTSWSAVYHVLQRWGAYEGLRRFTDVFDEHGMFRSAGTTR